MREASAWCLGGTTYLIMSFRLMTDCHSDKIRTRAARQDDSAVVILVVILLAMFSSFAAIFGLLSEAKAASNGGKLLFAGVGRGNDLGFMDGDAGRFHPALCARVLCAGSAIRDGRSRARFPETTTPDYWDFFYFATSIGAASQTSDVSINDRSLRRLVTLHAIVSFFFNTMVLALAINLAASLA